MIDHQIIQGDCVRVLPTLPAACVDFVLTDPPYLVRYRDRSGRTIVNDDDPASILGSYGEIARVMKPDTFCVSFYGWTSIPTFFEAWCVAGLHPVGHIVWHKRYASRRGFLCACHEQAYLLAKGRPPKPAVPLDDVRPWEYSGNVAHPTEKAVGILKPLIQSFCPPGGVVLDPFAGSGSTLVAAALTGRGYVGVELEQKYVEFGRRRLVGVERAARSRAA